jgi:hypothetical protein
LEEPGDASEALAAGLDELAEVHLGEERAVEDPVAESAARHRVAPEVGTPPEHGVDRIERRPASAEQQDVRGATPLGEGREQRLQTVVTHAREDQVEALRAFEVVNRLRPVQLLALAGRLRAAIEQPDQVAIAAARFAESSHDVGDVHFAIEAGIIAAAIAAGDPDTFLDSTADITEGILAAREALAVVKARGIDVDAVPDAQMFFAPTEAVAPAIREQYQVDRAARKIMTRHTGGDELGRIVGDVLASAHALGVATPVLAKLEPAVDAYAGAAAAS